MAGINNFAGQAKQFWDGLGVKQRLLLGAGGLVTVGVLMLFVRLLGTPEYKPLFSGLEAGDVQSLTAQLRTKNIPFKVSTDEKSIMVPADQIDAARLEVASQGMPHSGRLGFELFDKMSWGQTEFDEKVNYQRALEGELERTIATLQGVESARVHLVMPSDSVFIDRQRAAKASVILKMKRGSLSGDTQLAISRLVAGAVTDLNPENVSVIDAETNRPFNGGRGSSVASAEDEMTERIRHTLEPVVGPQSVRASVNVEYDSSTMEESQEKYDPATTVALTMQKSEERITGGSMAGVPGTTSNVPGSTPAAQPAVNNAEEGQTSKSESGTYAVNKTVRRTVSPAGRIRRITAAVLVDDALETQQQNGKSVEVRRKRTPEELKQLEQLASAAIGLDATRGDVLSIENLSFERPHEEATPVITKVEKIRKTVNDWSSSIRYVALIVLFLLAYMLLLRPIKKHAVDAFKQLPERAAAKQVAAGDGGEYALSAGDVSKRSATLKKQLSDKIKTEPATGGRLVEAWLREE